MSEGTRSAQRINQSLTAEPLLLDRVDTRAITTPIRMVAGESDGAPAVQTLAAPRAKTMAELEAEAEQAAFDHLAYEAFRAEQARISRHLRMAAGLGFALLIAGAAWLRK